MAYVYDSETEALRAELMQLPHKELIALAHQEGVHIKGRAQPEIVEALLRMDCEDDAAATSAKHAPGQLAPHRDQPSPSRHAGQHSSSTYKQQQHEHLQHGHVQYTSHQSFAAQAYSKHQQQQQYESHRPSAAHHPPSAAAAGVQKSVAGLQSLQQHCQPQQQQLQRAQEQQVRRQQQHTRHSEHEQELQHESSFTFAASSANAGGTAGSNCSPARYSAARPARGDDSRDMPYQDQVHSEGAHSAGTHAPAPIAAAAARGSGSSGRISARRGSMTPTNPSREAYKPQQHLVLETKMQQLEQSLQQLQRSPRRTPRHSSVSAQQSYISNVGQSSGGGSAVSGSGGGSAAKTNRRLWSSPSVSGQSQPSPAPAAAGGATAMPVSPYLQPPLSRNSKRPSSRSGSQGIGRSPEPFASASHSGSNGSRSSSRPWPSSALVSAPTAGSGAVGARAGSSGGGAYGSSNILAEFAAQRPAAATGAGDSQHVPSPSPSPQPSSEQKLQHARSLSMSPAPAKGTPRVGVMPCQKALLKKAAQEAAKAAAASAAPGSVSKQASAERLYSTKGSGSGGGSSRERSAVSSSGVLSRGAASSSGVVTRSGSSARPGTPETPSRARQAAAAIFGATTPTAAAAQRPSSSKGSIIRPLSPGIWSPAGAVPPPSPKMFHTPSGRTAASVSGSQLRSQTAAGRLLSSSATGRISASVNGVLSGVTAQEERRRVKADAASSLHTDPTGSWSEAGAGVGAGLDRGKSRGESISGAARASSNRASVSGSIRAGRTPRGGGAATPPPSSQASRAAASARGSAVSHSGAMGYSSSSNGAALQQREQAASVTGTGLAGRARQMLAGSPVLGRHARETSNTAGAGSLAARQQQESAAAAKQHQLLHTPLRVKPPAAAGTAASSRAGASQAAAQQQGAAGVSGYSTPIASKTRSMAAAAAAAVSAAVTPARQQVRAFSDALSAAYGDTAATPAAAGRTKTAPLAGTAAAAAAAAASDGPAVMIGGLMTPKAAAMGSARRVASTQARTAVAAAAAAAQDTAAMTDRGGAAGVPVTPLHKGARRTVPSEAGAGDEVDKHLQALVERCLRIRSPDAHKLALQGPEPAKRWLQQHVIGPWKRARANSSSSGGNGGPCMAAGYCCRSLLLHGPSGSGKTELVYALATEMGANVLYVPGGENLLKTYQQEGHRLLRALFAVARRVAPCVVCFDDAHMNFPSSMSRMSDPGGAAAIARMIVELEVQLQQLSDMQSSLELAATQPQVPQSAQKASGAGRTTPRRSTKSSSGGGSSGDGSALKPVWGFFGCKAKSKSQEQSPEEGVQQQKPQQGGYAKIAGPVVVVFVTHRPEALDGALLQQLPVQLQLDLPATEAREDLLMGWLMEREAAVNVQDVDWLAQQTEGFSCSDLVQLCNQAARRPAQERAICMSDLEVALDSMLSARQQQQQPKQQQQQYQQAQQLQQYQQQRQQQQQLYQAQQQYYGGSTLGRRQHAGR